MAAGPLGKVLKFKMKILFFSLHSAIWVHAFPEALIAEALQDAGHEINYLTCGEQLQAGCTAMSAVGVTSRSKAEQRQEICGRCTAQANLLRGEFALGGRDLASYIEAVDRQQVDALIEKTTRQNFLDLTVHEVSVGRLALYEFLLATKKSSIAFESDDEWNQYCVSLKNTLYAVFGGMHILDQVKPDALVVYNSLYPVNNVLCHLADLRGIRRYMLHAGGNLGHRLETMMFVRGDVFNLLADAKKFWAKHCHRPVRADVAVQITDHFLELLKGRSAFAYSAPKADAGGNIRERFGIKPAQKILCATLSSYDERFAAETIGSLRKIDELLFPHQKDWVRELITYVTSRDDLFLIIRVHPREFPNKREGVKSAHAEQLEATLRELPANVVVNWPKDQLSLYDLAEHTDVFLNAWSSVGKEMTLLGIPVVVYSEDYILYPANLNYIGQDRESYFAAIEQALTDGWRYENVRQAYRWYQIEFGSMLLDIGDSYIGGAPPPDRLVPRALRKLWRAVDPLREQRAECRRRARPLASAMQFVQVIENGFASALDVDQSVHEVVGNDVEERAILRSEMARLAQAMFRVQDTDVASPLRRRIEAFVGAAG